MRLTAVIPALMLSACAVPSDLHRTLSGKDLILNRPNTDIVDARLRLSSNGAGTFEFLGGDHGAQPVDWTLRNDQFCLIADEGLIASFGCAKIEVYGSSILLSHIGSDSTATGVLMDRTR